MSELVKHFNDLGFSIVAIPDEYFVKYKIYEQEGYSAGTKVPYFKRKGVISYQIEDYKEAQIAFEGTVKWDGCSNWDLQVEDCMFHGCCKEHLVNIGLILGEAWTWTKELIPNTWDGE